MNNRMLIALAAAAMLGLAGPALAADSGKAKGKSHSAGSAHSNKGGAAKGLNRADQSAGIHGDVGRDKAEAKGKRK